MKNVT